MTKKKGETKGEVLRFMVVGGVSALLHSLVYWLMLKADIPYNFSYFVGLVLGLVCNFFGSNLFTFRTKPTLARAAKFALSNVANFATHFVLLNLFVWLKVPEAIAPAAVYTLAFPLNFLLIRLSLKSKGNH